MKSWYSYYFKKPTDASNLLLHWQYLSRILWLRPKRFLEIGCGRAQHALFIQKILSTSRVSVLDKNKRLLKDIKSRKVQKIAADVLNKKVVASKAPTVDLVFSQGLMEHFKDKEIIQIIDNFRNKTSRFLFSVPSENYPARDFGNEILRNKKEYDSLFKIIPNIKYSVTPYFDIGLRTKLLGAKLRKLDFVRALEYIFLQSNHLLVEIRYLGNGR